MAKLPRDCSGRQAVRAFQRAGWAIARQTASHIILVQPGHCSTLSVPDHRVLDPGLLRSLIRHAELSVEEFVRLL
ncbi:MAG: type II toxin-antitoxin system HicA family toxin [Candidatus Omnitrophica bacterium]|nr:type II toxin-antitoxin system HicA family toxin [Candidatus Omnitrophota bacterium]MBI3021179.1 type II toxin-antitoxin system HicA family toxin [Candidatus Omnitrophota bacterium]